MDRPISSKSGFLLAETCIAIFAVSLIALLCVPFHEFASEDYYSFASSYLLEQSRALLSSQNRELQSAEGTITFNGNGNVRTAQTIHFSGIGKEIVIELGGGRLVFRS